MPQESKKPLVKFEPGSRQPFVLYLITVTIICAIIVLLCLFTGGVSFSFDKGLTGDVNDDGIVDLKDTSLLTSYIEGKAKLSDEQMKAADIDGNGEINSKDFMLIMKQIEPKEVPTTEDKQDSTKESASEKSTSQTETATPKVNPDYVTAGCNGNSAFFTSETGIYYIARIVNNWKDENGKNMYQIELSVKNNSTKTLYNTSANISFSGGISVEKEWGCSTQDDTGIVAIKTKNDGRILTGGTYSCGFIISSAKEITIKSVEK